MHYWSSVELIISKLKARKGASLSKWNFILLKKIEFGNAKLDSIKLKFVKKKFQFPRVKKMVKYVNMYDSKSLANIFLNI